MMSTRPPPAACRVIVERPKPGHEAVDLRKSAMRVASSSAERVEP